MWVEDRLFLCRCTLFVFIPCFICFVIVVVEYIPDLGNLHLVWIDVIGCSCVDVLFLLFLIHVL